MKKRLINRSALWALWFVLGAPITLTAYTELPGQTLETDMNLSAGTYLLKGNLVVPEGKTLTLQPGVVIKADSWWRAIIAEGGRIVANAGGASPIIFTSQNDSAYGESIPNAGEAGPDQWAGVLLRKTAATEVPAEGTFINCRFRFGGGWSFGMIESMDSDLHVQDCFFEGSAEAGIYIVGGPFLHENQPFILNSVFRDNLNSGIFANHDLVPEKLSTRIIIRDCTFDGNRSYAMKFTGCVVGDFDGSNELIVRPSCGNGISIYGSTNVSHRIEFPGPDFPFVLENNFDVLPGADLLIEGGVILKSNSWWRAMTATAASITANGTPEAPVYFTSYSDDTIGGDTNGDGTATLPGPDQWGGVRLLPGEEPDRAPSTGMFIHTHFRYGGGWTSAMLEAEGSALTASDCSFSYSAEEGARVTATEGNPANATFTRCTFKENGTLGFNIHDPVNTNLSEPTLFQCVFDGNKSFAGRINGNIFPITSRSNELVLRQGVTNGVAIGHTLHRSGTLEAFGLEFPYILDSNLVIPHGISLDIGPGTIVKANSWWHTFIVHGSLAVDGNRSSPVIFTSVLDDSVAGDTNGDDTTSTGAPDQWGGIYLTREEAANTAGSVTATHLYLYYGGGWTSGLISSEGGSIDCTDCRFRYSGEAGVYFNQEGSRTASLSFSHCEFTENATQGIQVTHETGPLIPVVHGCTFTGNKNFAMKLTGDIFPDFDGMTTIAQGPPGKCGIAINGTIQGSGRLEYPGDPAPYILAGAYHLEPGAALSIDPGVVIKGDSWWHFFDVQSATFTAQGTAAMPIVFTSYMDDTIVGDTNGDGSDSSGGPDQWGGVAARANASITLDYCKFLFGAGYTDALVSVDASTASIDNVIFQTSPQHGVFVRGASSVTIRESAFTEMAQDAVRNTSSTHMVDARGNFWGHDSGPLDSSDADDLVKAGGYMHWNPLGQGESVSNNVVYDDWRGNAPVWKPYLWADTTDGGNGWRHSNWYGWFNDLLYPFISHVEHGWQYCLGDSQNSFSVYDYALRSWIVVSKNRYPLVYLSGRNAGWYWYFTGGQSPNRWFYSYATGQYVNEADLR